MWDDNYYVVMFVKSPERGMVKSRLAATLQEVVVPDLYKFFVSDTMGMLAQGGYPLIIFFYPPESKQKIIQWLGNEHTLFPQTGNDLGERMKNAFKTIFSQGHSPALLIGSDSPDLPALIIDEALTSLKDHDAVVGPSYDGGYYLIGFRTETFLPRAFDEIPWSTPGVFVQTLDVLVKANLRVHILPKWRDIDTFADLKALFLNSQNTLFAKSATMKYMQCNELYKRLTL
ncbi:MAG: TIGR04282 family arsenosugar biosynthesis glycosyltransferase [Proteobacteria bacterium]|nr:TIGR04282 family arsenosugar biosynthesis glycosyltransferase [Pseudomonadota bacterium]